MPVPSGQYRNKLSHRSLKFSTFKRDKLYILKRQTLMRKRKQKLVSELFRNITGDENCLVVSTV